MCNPELAQCSEEVALLRLTFQNVPLSFLCFLVLLSLPSKHTKVRATITPPAKHCSNGIFLVALGCPLIAFMTLLLLDNINLVLAFIIE